MLCTYTCTHLHNYTHNNYLHMYTHKRNYTPTYTAMLIFLHKKLPTSVQVPVVQVPSLGISQDVCLEPPLRWFFGHVL